jgi:hypothetical protein
MYSSKHRLDLTNIPQNKLILINPRILVVKYIKQNNYFSKIIGYNKIK